MRTSALGSVQLEATAIKIDGTVENVTAQTQWSSDAPDVAQVTPKGLATGLRVGEARVVANYQAVTTHYGAASVLVLAPGTYKVAGRMTDSGTPVANVSVEVEGADGIRVIASSGPDGRFALYGVTGMVRLRASREGYLTQIHDVDVRQSLTRDLELVPDRQRFELAGVYVLTVRLGACEGGASAGFSDALSTRRYTAIVSQTGPTLTVSLRDAEFVVRNGRGDSFQGSIDTIGNVQLQIGDPDDWYLSQYPELAERVDATVAFLAYGTVTAKATARDVTGRLAGTFVISDPGTPSFWSQARSAWCYSGQHAFEMRRR